MMWARCSRSSPVSPMARTWPPASALPASSPSCCVPLRHSRPGGQGTRRSDQRGRAQAAGADEVRYLHGRDHRHRLDRQHVQSLDRMPARLARPGECYAEAQNKFRKWTAGGTSGTARQAPAHECGLLKSAALERQRGTLPARARPSPAHLLCVAHRLARQSGAAVLARRSLHGHRRDTQSRLAVADETN